MTARLRRRQRTAPQPAGENLPLHGSTARGWAAPRPSERRYMEQKQKIGMKKMGKVANKSYKDRMQDFNQYLANLSEHYDIPKVGPG
uniref:CGI-like protein n=1 Tax=Zea mays TaxID=4577 RepID=A0A804NVN1_MAIZE